jgi:hypothetical protein
MSISILIIFLTLYSSGARAELMQKSVKSYTDWKLTNDMFLKGCSTDASELQKPTQPGTMQHTQQKNLKIMHVPTLQLNRDGISSDILSKLDNIDTLAKTKAVVILKNSKKASIYTEDAIQKTNGRALALEADLVPEDYLRSFDYKTSCVCRYTSNNIASDETAYNKISASEFIKLEDRNRLTCFAKSASI